MLACFLLHVLYEKHINPDAPVKKKKKGDRLANKPYTLWKKFGRSISSLSGDFIVSSKSSNEFDRTPRSWRVYDATDSSLDFLLVNLALKLFVCDVDFLSEIWTRHSAGFYARCNIITAMFFYSFGEKQNRQCSTSARNLILLPIQIKNIVLKK